MKNLVFILMTFLFIPVQAQNILQEYIDTGLKNNLALLRQEDNYRRSLEVLHEARGLFYPAISLNARYTVSEGGRVIEFPAGDLLNDAYSTLNLLTASDRFPVIENQEIRFLRPTEHETKLRLVQPVFNTGIYYNSKIKREVVISEQIGVEQYRRELITEIKKAYYNAAMTHRVVEMLRNTRLLLVENVRINMRLEDNDKVTHDVVLRSQTELHEFDQQFREAYKNRQISNSYLNFLLNRPLTDSVIVEEPPDFILPQLNLAEYIQQATSKREELRNMEQLVRINELSLSMNQSGKLPDIMLVADYGFQGERYEFNRDNDYFQASAVLSWNLFSGLQNRSKIRQSMIQKDAAEKQLDEARNRISLQVISVIEELKTTYEGLEAAELQLQTAREGFRLVNRRYQEGQVSLIEFMDSRNSLTRAEENLILLKYSCLSKYADFENAIVVNNP